MITVGAKRTSKGIEYFAVLGPWASKRSYPGREGFFMALREAFAYENDLRMKEDLAEEDDLAEKEFWDAFERELALAWDEYRKATEVMWEQKMLSADFEEAVRLLPLKYGLTRSATKDLRREYSYCSPDRLWEAGKGFDHPVNAANAARRHRRAQLPTRAVADRPLQDGNNGPKR